VSCAQNSCSCLPPWPDFPDTPLLQSVLHAKAAYEDFARNDAVGADEDAATVEKALATRPEPVQVTLWLWKRLRPVDIERLSPCGMLCRISPPFQPLESVQKRLILRTSMELLRWRHKGPALSALHHRFARPAQASHEDHGLKALEGAGARRPGGAAPGDTENLSSS